MTTCDSLLRRQVTAYVSHRKSYDTSTAMTRNGMGLDDLTPFIEGKAFP